MSSAASPLGSTAPAPAPAQNSSPSPPAAAAAPSATPLPPLSSSSSSSSSTVPPPPSAAPIPLSPNLPPPPPPPPPPPSPAAANSSPIATTTTHSSPKLTPPSPPSSLPSPPSSISTTSLIIAVGIGGLLFLSIITIIICCLCQKTCRRWKKKKKKTDHHPPQEIYGLPGGFPAHAIYKDSYDSPNLRADFSSSPFYSYNASSILNKSPPPPPPPPPLVVAPFKQGYDAIPKATPPGIANSKYRFTYEELEAATDGFSMSNKLGEGGFGCVYKGRVSGGQLVAVKQLKLGASQGEKEFQAEVEIISRVHHRHLVSLVGYCISEHQRLLVYDYVPNGTLEYHLHKRKNGPALDWSMRLRIACGAARGLAYLHEDCHPRIIHRDIKSSNILLDDKFEAQVSDFGLAKLTADTDTHVTTRVMGTFGYLAPEYASSGKLTEKSDVFSFGVVLLELLTGRKPVDVSQPVGQESLVEWARPLLGEIKSEVYLDIVADPDLNGVYDPKEMLRMVKAAAACVRHSASRRPRMGLVVRALEAEISLLDLDKGLRPGHISRDYNHEHGSSYNIEMRKFKELTLGSQEFEIKYSGTTSAEYKANQSSFMMSSGEYQQTIAGQGTRLTPEAVASSSSTTSSPTRQVGTPLDNHTPLSGLNRDMRSDRDQNVTTSPRSRFYQQTKGNRGTSSS